MAERKNHPAAEGSHDLEKSLAELEAITKRMEKGEQPLQDAMRDFERGMELAETCRKHLANAQQRVDKLVKKQKGFELQEMSADEYEEE